MEITFVKKEDARSILSYHSGRNPDIDNDRWRNGYLGILRPYRGKISVENFIEIMECLNVLKDEFQKTEINRELIADVNGIIHYSNMWTEKDGMLDGILSEEQVDLIRKWTAIISYCVICLLENNDEAFYEYEDYIQELRENQ